MESDFDGETPVWFWAYPDIDNDEYFVEFDDEPVSEGRPTAYDLAVGGDKIPIVGVIDRNMIGRNVSKIWLIGERLPRNTGNVFSISSNRTAALNEYKRMVRTANGDPNRDVPAFNGGKVEHVFVFEGNTDYTLGFTFIRELRIVG